MKAIITVLLISCAVVATWLAIVEKAEPSGKEFIVLKPQPEPKVTPVRIQEPPVIAEPPVEAAPVLHPVQPIEERGDALLFEADALQGTPFDQSITMPFD
jgi:hypothetical protein